MRTEVIPINPLVPETDKIRICANVLRSGGLVAFPTETVYGIGANMLNKQAVERLYKVKQRPKDKPFTIHISKKEKAEEFSKDIPLNAYKLMDKFWPGPLTVILKSKNASDVGLRMPKNLIALSLIEKAGVPVIVPSANLSGNKPPTNKEDVFKSFNGLIDIIIDGGNVEIGVESTIVDFTKDDFKIIRQGAIHRDDIQKIAKTKNILFVCTGNSCRSVMAEALFRKMMKKRDDIEIYSAGTGTAGGMRPSRETITLLRMENIDVSAHLSRPLSDDLIKKSDLILVMTKEQQDIISARLQAVKSRVYLLKEFANLDNRNMDIEDPIGQSMSVYEDVFATIKNSLDKIKELI